LSGNVVEHVTISSHLDIDALYRNSMVPVLSPEVLGAIMDYLRTHGCENMGGALIFGQPAIVNQVISLLNRNLTDLRHTFRGPNVLGDRYYPNGLAIWTRGDLA
jgi:hypothetical protein